MRPEDKVFNQMLDKVLSQIEAEQESEFQPIGPSAVSHHTYTRAMQEISATYIPFTEEEKIVLTKHLKNQKYQVGQEQPDFHYLEINRKTRGFGQPSSTIQAFLHKRVVKEEVSFLMEVFETLDLAPIQRMERNTYFFIFTDINQINSIFEPFN